MQVVLSKWICRIRRIRLWEVGWLDPNPCSRDPDSYNRTCTNWANPGPGLMDSYNRTCPYRLVLRYAWKFVLWFLRSVVAPKGIPRRCLHEAFQPGLSSTRVRFQPAMCIKWIARLHDALRLTRVEISPLGGRVEINPGQENRTNVLLCVSRARFERHCRCKFRANGFTWPNRTVEVDFWRHISIWPGSTVFM